MEENNTGIAETKDSYPENVENVTANEGHRPLINEQDENMSGDAVDAAPLPTTTTTSSVPQRSVVYDRHQTSHLISTRYTEQELEKYGRYKMNHCRRGVALIFNHERFKEQSLRRREGAAEDGRTLEDTLKRLGFDVRHYKDSLLNEIRDIFDQVAKEDHSECDCLFVAVMTHGEKGEILYASDYPYKAEEVWGRFKGEKVPSLAGKPKIFLFQACRGRNLEESIITYDTTDTASSRSIILPSSSDFLMIYSTMEGHYSWRNTTEGSWLIQDLCMELNKDARKKDILSILTNTLRRVAFSRFSNTPNTPSMNKRQQMPTFSSTLTKFLYFDETSV